MTREFFAGIDKITLGLDDSFKFHCTMCGACCVNRDDIMLNPRDVYRIAKYLEMEPVEFFKSYCSYYIGDSSRMPIVKLNAVGPMKRCPLLKGKQCAVQSVKPSVCALFPLGRYMKFETENFTPENIAKGQVRYMLQDVDCGDKSETHTVREWLKDFDIETADETYIQWNIAIAEIGRLLKKAEKCMSEKTMEIVWGAALSALYLNYSTEDEFLTQFKQNVKEISAVLSLVDLAEVQEDGVKL